MILSPMRYKSYTWPHNPRVYSIDYRRTMAANKVPFGGYQLQDLGAAHRVMEGEGEFVGAGAYFQFQRLASVFYDKGPGLLVHPLWQVATTYYVRYSFQFWEENGLTGGLAIRDTELSAGESGAGAQQGNAPAVYHRVVKGDTLWGLAVRYGEALEELTALNPQIKNPNLIRVGEEVRVR